MAENKTKASTLKRYYSPKTLKVLFALSGNQCAHPDCTNTLIEPATEQSDALVTGHICHIYAISVDGPRGKFGLTEKEINAPENLILLCRHHHGIVDGQHETYPAEMLRGWKQTHEGEMQKRLSADLEGVQPDVFSHPYFPKALVDQKIEDEIDILRKSRFFGEFDRIRSSLALGRRLTEGELSGGTDAVRSRALAWCARLLSPSEELEKAEEYLNVARTLGTGPDIEVADAFIVSRKGDKGGALAALAAIESPSARSAALMVVAHHDGPEGALIWLKDAGIEISDLDPEGKHYLLMRQLELARWEDAEKTVDALNDRELTETPVLYHLVGITRLLSTVPVEFRAVVLNQLPLEAASFPLASDATAIESRRTAQRHFVEAAEIERQLNCPGIAAIDDEYALWLELRDPETAESGRQRLEVHLRDPKSALRLVPLGLQFGIKPDLAAVEREIERQIALHGGITQDAAIARFALAFVQKSPRDVANYIARHHDQLSRYLDKKALGFIHIEALARAGLPEGANERLQLLSEEGLSEAEEARLRRIIAEAEGADPVEVRKAQFKQTDSLSDLVALTDELDATESWEELCQFGEALFERTHSVRDAERLANALSKAQKNERLVEFLRGLADFRGQSKVLQMAYCWSLYQEGDLLEARTELAGLSEEPDNQYYRALQVNLGIALGDWHSLTAFVAAEYQARDQRSAVDLIGAAQLAHHLGSPHAKDLTFAAASKGEDDAGVLAAAYFLASTAGWEDDEKVVQWLHKAAELSGEEGPIQKMTLKDLAERKPEWDRRESETWKMLGQGNIPIFLAAYSLNKSLVDLMLFPALANLSERDPRRRSAIPAYSGQRQPAPLDTAGMTTGVDATALLTLSFLNLLDKAFDTFDAIHVPHSTLVWLFEEKQKAIFHQPSRIRDAHRIRDLLARDILARFVLSTVADSDLSAQVGDELAMLIAEAEKTREDDNTQHVVVRPSPVHRLGSLMVEEADLTEHAAVISSCLSIVERLRQKGQITADEEKKARAYLQLHEKPWPQQPDIQDGAVLYLDDLSMTYFLHLGILEKLEAAGFKAVASPDEISQGDALISYGTISDKATDAIERIRRAVSIRIESGKIKIGRQRKLDDPEKHSISEHPTVGALALAGTCDSVLIDDRFINQHANIEEGGAHAVIFTTLDLLGLLASTGATTPEEDTAYRTLLRRAGYFFVPVREDELAWHLSDSSVVAGKVVETAELKAIRESILRVRMSNWLQLPKEAFWLDRTLKVFILGLKDLWKPGADLPVVTALSDWIVEQIDVRGWAQALGPDGGDNIVKTGRGAHILMLLTPPNDVPQDIKNSYWEWVEDNVLAPVEEQFPELYGWIVEWQKKQISEMADMDLVEGEAT